MSSTESSGQGAASSAASESKSGEDSFIPSTPTRNRCPSPLLGASKPTGTKSCCSPPPAPRPYANSSAGGSEVSTESVFIEINSGRSLLNPKQVDIFSGFNMPRKALYTDFEHEAENVHTTVRPSIDCGFFLMSPLRRASTISAITTDEEEEEDLDMPYVPSPIRLQMRSTVPRSPTAVSGFIPILHEEASQHQG